MSKSKPIKINDTGINVSELISEKLTPPVNANIQLSKANDIHKNNVSDLSKLLKASNSLDKKEDDPKEVEEMKFIIEKYLTSVRFSDFLKEKGVKIPKSTKLKDLRSTLIHIKLLISNRNVAKFYDGFVKQGSKMFEMMMTPIVDIEGFSDVLMMNDEFLDCIEELKINAKLPVFPPHIRALYIAIQTASACYYVNSMKREHGMINKINNETNNDIAQEEEEEQDNENKDDEKIDYIVETKKKFI